MDTLPQQQTHQEPMLDTLLLPVIVTSNVKKTISKYRGFNTSADSIEVLNRHIHLILIDAMESAAADGRKTVMARDFRGITK